jgi:hypothetical protein
MTSIAELMGKLNRDPFRVQWDFTTEMAMANAAIAAAKNPGEIARVLGDWIAMNQPCIFGRAAARAETITFCILTDEELSQADDVIRERIAADRGIWQRRAVRGKSSAFVIACISERLLKARPDDKTLKLAQRLVNLYLGVLAKPDEIYTDTVIYRDADSNEARIWPAGVNYFAAHADERWWRDHRIPGGIALSMNSVGHLAHSSSAASNLPQEIAFELASGGEPPVSGNINRPQAVLELAMRTIRRAVPFKGESATGLRNITNAEAEVAEPRCPFHLAKDLKDQDWREYDGWYHTDITLPVLYFRDDQNRPLSAKKLDLDFTYIYHDAPSNPDHKVFRGVKL